ncbi:MULTISPECIES: plasmid partitioning protein RepB [Rhizobium]|uniref:Plasmid partitioning protein RepB n=1 Tax=Rhizobium leguminosarum bv. viciae TaxID=387 RepID=A0A8G2MQ88_RHILV|nr:plasmid partitioning protein RepB [Rhizobium leguminosarum]MBY5399999.1 plasmid partitioning protein RepB [Rhizobium leguminosarum]MBY5481811.1 plasmid partitioning protein RepB [Rhizobium leguminosarum]MBY5508309.1 plasmid partitioning protein RepB [Rhizobium leguminosarum]MBY5516218.1 plasmid partitioning protein RepB [Rhizobium leguminosarum]NKK10328.1 plasmid partitioning protein RepB [Rhizobium leguminosarum bv. viciae]
MSKSPRKSIVASFGLLSAELESDQAADQQQPSQAPAPVPGNRVGAGVIGAAHRAIDDIRTERDRLKAIVESGGGAVRELDPSLIDPSPYPDRLPDDDATGFEAFKRSIETEGQQVPVQVRKHPSSPGRYQIVYGHRRWLAARQLNRPVRALEVEISDLDLVLAQGIENAGRQDLTWIERALFASRMDDAGIKPRHIYAALSIEDAELARMRNVYRIVPADIIEAIGRAPKIGRPRWLDLAKTVAGDTGALDALRAVLVRKGEEAETSDQRFQRALNAIKPVSAGRREPSPITDMSGTRLGALLISSKEVRISAEGSLGGDFLKFIEAELPALTERFVRLREDEKP